MSEVTMRLSTQLSTNLTYQRIALSMLKIALATTNDMHSTQQRSIAI